MSYPTLVIIRRATHSSSSPDKRQRDPVIHAGAVVITNSYFTYILASQRQGTIYTGVTNDLVRRVFEHREGGVEGFTKKYNVKMLVWYEVHATIAAAIQREKNIKHWSRDWKIQLIEKMNPEWNDLYEEICG